ncbi:MAG: hypothetical protein P1U87_08810 [Verrucomicrobiales bacterium]|nr:hypothetical protein [Verrucomicrobiales bacterium]
MKRPGSLIVCFLIPAIVFMLGLILAGVYGYREIPPLFHESARGEVPNGFSTVLEAPGNYTVWLHVPESDLEKFRNLANKLPPGASIHVFDVESGIKIDLTSWISSTKSLGEESAISLGAFTSQRQGQQIEVKGSGLREAVLVSVAPSNMNKTLRIVLTIMGIVLVFLTASIFLFIFLLHRRQKMLEEAPAT